jgi:hypothetical protein
MRGQPAVRAPPARHGETASTGGAPAQCAVLRWRAALVPALRTRQPRGSRRSRLRRPCPRSARRRRPRPPGTPRPWWDRAGGAAGHRRVCVVAVGSGSGQRRAVRQYQVGQGQPLGHPGRSPGRLGASCCCCCCCTRESVRTQDRAHPHPRKRPPTSREGHPRPPAGAAGPQEEQGKVPNVQESTQEGAPHLYSSWYASNSSMRSGAPGSPPGGGTRCTRAGSSSATPAPAQGE